MDERELIFGLGREQLDQFKEVKVRLPVGHLIRLHGIKIVNGRGISETISEALTHYFQEIGHHPDAPGADAPDASA